MLFPNLGLILVLSEVMPSQWYSLSCLLPPQISASKGGILGKGDISATAVSLIELSSSFAFHLLLLSSLGSCTCNLFEATPYLPLLSLLSLFFFPTNMLVCYFHIFPCGSHCHFLFVMANSGMQNPHNLTILTIRFSSVEM